MSGLAVIGIVVGLAAAAVVVEALVVMAAAIFVVSTIAVGPRRGEQLRAARDPVSALAGAVLGPLIAWGASGAWHPALYLAPVFAVAVTTLAALDP